MSLSLVPWGLAGLLAFIAGLLFWRLDAAHEQLGALQQANRQLTEAIAAKQAATDSRARTDADVRKLAPDDVLERMK